jgi:DNA-binding transcriptional MerR regulator
MLTVSEFANQSKVPAHVVRYYMRIGLIEPAGQKENGYRLFAARDTKKLHFIRMAKQLGFTLNEIKSITQHSDQGESPCGEVRKIIQDRIEENRVKIEEMLNLQIRMEHALKQWETMPDGVPDGNSVCHLIESFDVDDAAKTE